MASLTRADNELFRARGGQLHTIRLLIKSSEVTARPRTKQTKQLVGEGTLLLPLPLKFSLFFKVLSSRRPSLTAPCLPGPAYPRIQPMGTT